MLLDQILKEAVYMGASDVHLSPQTQPIVRLNTRLMPFSKIVLQQEDLEQMALKILGDEGFLSFQLEGEIDTSYRIDGIGNFRINIYRHQDMIAIAARIINTVIPIGISGTARR